MACCFIGSVVGGDKTIKSCTPVEATPEEIEASIKKSKEMNCGFCSHLDPNNGHITFRVNKAGNITIKTFDENILKNILHKFQERSGGGNKNNNSNNYLSCWSYLRAMEMLSDTQHLNRISDYESVLYHQDQFQGSSKQQKQDSSSSSLSKIFNAYFKDLDQAQQHVYDNPTSWNLIQLSFRVGGLGKGLALVSDPKKPGEKIKKELSFSDLINGASSVLKKEKAELEQLLLESTKTKDSKHSNKRTLSLKQEQDLFTKERLTRATEAKILAAKCLSSRKVDYSTVIEDFCRPAVAIDRKAASESAFTLLSRGYEANQAHEFRSKVKDKKWFSIFDEAIAPIVNFPCSTCSSPCDSAPKTRLPWGLSVSVGELREKLDILNPTLLPVLSKYASPMECETVKKTSGKKAEASDISSPPVLPTL